MDVLWRSLDTDGRTWKQIFKVSWALVFVTCNDQDCKAFVCDNMQSLTLIEFLIKNGAERFIESARDKLHAIRRLEDYNFYEGSVDKGTGIREKAKQVVEILNSNELIRSEREKARALRNKFGGVSSNSYGGSGSDSSGFGSTAGRDYNTSDRRASSYSERNGGSYSDSYSNGGIDSGNGSKYGDKSGSGSTNTGRYGGGAYDSDRPPRFGDDEPAAHSDRFNKPSDEERGYRPGAYKSDAEPAATTKGAKLKVSIKKEKSAQPTPAAPVVEASALNLIEDDFLSSPPITATPSNNAVHAFQSSAASNLFDNFSSSTTQQATAFDPFAPTAPTANAYAFGAPPSSATSVTAPVAQPFDPFFPTAQQTAPYQPQFQQQFQQHQPQQFQQQQPQQFQQQQPQLFQQQQPQQQHQSFPVAPTPHYSTSAQTFVSTQPPQAPAASAEADFGDFEAAPSAGKPKMDASSKWGDLGNLVDLGAIGKVEPKKDSSVNSAPATFSGLDGFSKNQQSMVTKSSCVCFCRCDLTYCALFIVLSQSPCRWLDGSGTSQRYFEQGTCYGEHADGKYGRYAAGCDEPAGHDGCALSRNDDDPNGSSHGRYADELSCWHGHGWIPRWDDGCTCGRDADGRDAYGWDQPACNEYGWAAAVSRYVSPAATAV